MPLWSMLYERMRDGSRFLSCHGKRPCMMVVDSLLRNASHGHHARYVSLDVTASAITLRLFLLRARVDGFKIRSTLKSVSWEAQPSQGI